MELIAITDVHGRKEMPKTVMDRMSSVDLIVIAGDITNFGGYKDARDIIQSIAELNDRIVAIPGNCDRMTVNRYLTDNDLSIHMTGRVVQDAAFYGVGGSGKTPFHTPQEYPDQDVTEMLQSLKRQDMARWHVLVTHSPPAHTKLDRTIMGLHVGSKVIRSFIETFQPDLVICGHIHEARGADRIERTLCINPGIFPKHYAVISLDASLEYTLY